MFYMSESYFKKIINDYLVQAKVVFPRMIKTLIKIADLSSLQKHQIHPKFLELKTTRNSENIV